MFRYNFHVDDSVCLSPLFIRLAQIYISGLQETVRTLQKDISDCHQLLKQKDDYMRDLEQKIVPYLPQLLGEDAEN